MHYQWIALKSSGAAEPPWRARADASPGARQGPAAPEQPHLGSSRLTPIVTFSNRAAGELSERISATAPDQASRIWMGTFHAFGLDLVRRYHNRFGLSPNPPLFDRSDAIEVLEELLPTLPHVHYRDLWDPARILRDVVTTISRAVWGSPSLTRCLPWTPSSNAAGISMLQQTANAGWRCWGSTFQRCAAITAISAAAASIGVLPSFHQGCS